MQCRYQCAVCAEAIKTNEFVMKIFTDNNKVKTTTDFTCDFESLGLFPTIIITCQYLKSNSDNSSLTEQHQQ